MTTTAQLSKDQILTKLYSSREISDALRNVQPSYLRDDVKQHVFLFLYEKDAAFIIDLHDRDKLRPYVAKTIYNTVNFSESKFNRELRRSTEIPTESFNERQEDEAPPRGASGKVSRFIQQQSREDEESYDYEALVEACPVKLEAVYWYHRDLLKLYLELGTYRKVEAATGIPFTSVREAVIKAKAEMKKLLWEL